MGIMWHNTDINEAGANSLFVYYDQIVAQMTRLFHNIRVLIVKRECPTLQ